MQSQTKERIKFYTRVNLISLMRCHSLEWPCPRSFAYWYRFDYIFIAFSSSFIFAKIKTVLTSEQRSVDTTFFYCFSFFSILTLSHDWLIDWLIALHNKMKRVQHTILLCKWWQLMRDDANKRIEENKLSKRASETHAINRDIARHCQMTSIFHIESS